MLRTGLVSLVCIASPLILQNWVSAVAIWAFIMKMGSRPALSQTNFVVHHLKNFLGPSAWITVVKQFWFMLGPGLNVCSGCIACPALLHVKPPTVALWGLDMKMEDGHPSGCPKTSYWYVRLKSILGPSSPMTVSKIFSLFIEGLNSVHLWGALHFLWSFMLASAAIRGGLDVKMASCPVVTNQVVGMLVWTVLVHVWVRTEHFFWVHCMSRRPWYWPPSVAIWGHDNSLEPGCSKWTW